MGFRSDLWMDLVGVKILHYAGLDRHESVNIDLIQRRTAEGVQKMYCSSCSEC